ncbi:hypothetical protein MRY82_00455 [bacterium]|nr:hypothetical protein [bacterium]
MYNYKLYQDASMEQNYNDIKIQTPWIDIHAEIDQGYNEHDILKQLAHFPVCYIYPNNTQLFKGSYLISEKPNPYNLTKQLFKKTIHSNDIFALKKKSWEINLKKTLRQCHYHSKHTMFSSLHVYSIVRQWVKKHSSGKNSFSYINKFNHLINTDEESYLHLVKKFLRLNHYVTTRCHDALKPALNRSFSTKEVMQNYIHSKNGHDKILLMALNSLGKNLDQLPVNTWTKLSMDLLKLSSSYDVFFPAFIMLLERFEDTSLNEINPIADIFWQHPKTKTAGDCVQKHHETNLREDHFYIACTLLRHIPWITLEQCIACFRLTELLVTFIELDDQEIYGEFKKC